MNGSQLLDFDTAVQVVTDRILGNAPSTRSVEVDPDRIAITPPGFRLTDLRTLLTALGAPAELVPTEMPGTGITLGSLLLARIGDEWTFEFSIAWRRSTPIATVPALGATVAQITISYADGHWTALADATVDYDEYQLSGSVELPSGLVTAEVRREPSPGAPNAELPAVDHPALSGARLEQLGIVATVPLRHVALHLAVSDVLTVGPVSLTWVEADVVVGADIDSGGLLLAELDVVAHLDIALTGGSGGRRRRVLRVQVEGSCTPAGWRVDGVLVPDPPLTIGELIDGIGGNGADLPDTLRHLAIARLEVDLDSAADHVRFECGLRWSDRADAALSIAIDHRPSAIELSGRLHLGGADFELALQHSSGGANTVVATYASSASHPITVSALLHAVGATGVDASGVDIDVRAALLAIDGDGAVLAADIDGGVDLSALGDLPLVGHLLVDSDPVRLALRPAFVDGRWDDATYAVVRSGAPATLSLPAEPTAGVHLAAQLSIAGTTIPLETGTQSGAGAGSDGTRAAIGAPAAQPTAAAPARIDPGGNVSWVDVDRRIGPIHLARVGYALLDDDTEGRGVELLLDGDVAVAGITLELDGLGVTYWFASRKLTPTLSGLGIDVDRAPLRIAGAFVNSAGGFGGRVVLSTPEFTLSALGAFTTVDGAPSLFVYGLLDYPLGGPVFFFVEGLAAGFGFNRRLQLPDVDHVDTFPLVADAIGLGKGQEPATTEPSAQLGRIGDFVTPVLGEHFLAVGVKFTSFEIVDGFVLVVLSMGVEVEVDVLGVATIQNPPVVPAGVSPMLHVRLNVLARLNLTEGWLLVRATIAPGSYVYSPLCHLTGDMAFASWFAGDHAGDFVLTVGGYHPQFVVPSYYPSARRIELRFQVNRHVFLRGQAYFALTPAMLMAGGALHAQVGIGALEAWADFSIDFFVAWEPYHYDGQVRIEVGARWKCFHTTASLDLHVWGPDFSGRGHVQWTIFSFDIGFGSARSLPPQPLTWQRFRTSFLPADDAIVATSVRDGLVAMVDAPTSVADAPTSVAVVTPAGLRVGVHSVVPITTGGLAGALHDQLDTPATSLGIAPMNRGTLGESQFVVTVVDADGVDVSGRFTAQPVTRAFPAAMWGQSMTVDRNASSIVAVAGFDLVAAAPPRSTSSTTWERGSDDFSKHRHDGAPSVARRRYRSGRGDVAPVPVDDLAALGLDTTRLSRRDPITRVGDVELIPVALVPLEEIR